jgi:hypothetical protein
VNSGLDGLIWGYRINDQSLVIKMPAQMDIVAVKRGQTEFTWGAGKDLVAEGDARSQYLAALRALDADENDVKLLLDFARS